MVLLQWIDMFICPVPGEEHPRGLSWIEVGEGRRHWDAYVWHGGCPDKSLDPKTHTADFKMGSDITMAAEIHLHKAHGGRYKGPDGLGSKFRQARGSGGEQGCVRA